jgi:hypothetical protein
VDGKFWLHLHEFELLQCCWFCPCTSPLLSPAGFTLKPAPVTAVYSLFPLPMVFTPESRICTQPHDHTALSKLHCCLRCVSIIAILLCGFCLCFHHLFPGSHSHPANAFRVRGRGGAPRSLGTLLPRSTPLCHLQRPCDALVDRERGGERSELSTRCDLAWWQTRCPSVLGACCPLLQASGKPSRFHRRPVVVGLVDKIPGAGDPSFSLSPALPARVRVVTESEW